MLFILTEHFPPERGAGSTRAWHLYEGLKAHYPIKVIKPVFKNPFPKNSVLRPLNYLWFPLQLMWELPFKDGIFIFTSPPPFGILPLLLYGKRFILDIRDPWPESLQAYGIWDHPLVVRLLKALMNLAYKRAAAVVVATPSLSKYIPRKTYVITNAIPNAYKYIPQQQAKRKLGLNNKRLALFLGNMGYAYDFRDLNIPDDIEAVFIGDGVYADELKERGYRVLPPMAPEELSPWLAAADIGLLPLRKSPLFDDLIPAKVFDYMAYGLWVIGKRLPRTTKQFFKQHSYNRWKEIDGWDKLNEVPPKGTYSIPSHLRWNHKIREWRNVIESQLNH